MGRWAQARRTGGGPSTLNEIVEVFIDSGSILMVEWKYPVGPGVISLLTLTTSPNNRTDVSAMQDTPTRLAVTFSGSVLAETSLTATGTLAGFLLPQTIAITP